MDLETFWDFINAVMKYNDYIRQGWNILKIYAEVTRYLDTCLWMYVPQKLQKYLNITLINFNVQ